jgi:hypothetical protein
LLAPRPSPLVLSFPRPSLDTQIDIDYGSIIGAIQLVAIVPEPFRRRHSIRDASTQPARLLSCFRGRHILPPA